MCYLTYQYNTLGNLGITSSERKIEEVVPIVWDGGYVGTGFLVTIIGIPALVTCRHTLESCKTSIYNFIYKGKSYDIDKNSPNYVAKNGDIPEKDNMCWNDYAYYLLFNLCIDEPIELGSTKTVLHDDYLTIVSHNSETLEQIYRDCKRRNQKEFSEIEGTNYQNLIPINCQGITPGYSGSPVFMSEAKICIGFITSRVGFKEDPDKKKNVDWCRIIKSQTIDEQFATLYHLSRH